MREHKPTIRFAAGVAALAALALASCDAPAAPGDVTAETKKVAGPGASQQELVKALRQAVARFHSLAQATRAGYDGTGEPCVAAPGLGAMGVHFANRDLIDPAFDPLQPEVLLYEPQKNGQFKLLGVEFVVINVGQPAPTFGGQPFDVGGVPPLEALGIPHWTLHVWVWRGNPSGLFAPFNRAVSCAAAE